MSPTEQETPTPRNTQTNKNLKAKPEKQGGLSKFALVLIVLVLLIAAGLAAVRFGVIAAPGWLIQKLPPQLAPAVSQMTGLDSEEAKLAVMMETGRSGSCTMTNKETGETATYYVKGDKFKIDFSETDEETGEVIQGFVLNDAEYQYSWSSAEEQGVKFAIPSEEEVDEIDESVEEMQDMDFDWDDEIEENEELYDTNCQFRNIPDSEFVPPQDIEFIDFSEGFGEPFDFDMEGEVEMEGDQTEDDGSEELDSGAAEEDSSFEMPSEEDLEELEEWAQELEEQYQGTE